jgi:hypothetical protein
LKNYSFIRKKKFSGRTVADFTYYSSSQDSSGR